MRIAILISALLHGALIFSLWKVGRTLPPWSGALGSSEWIEMSPVGRRNKEAKMPLHQSLSNSGLTDGSISASSSKAETTSSGNLLSVGRGLEMETVLALGNRKPIYPEQARLNEIEGKVKLRFSVNHEGKVSGVSLLLSSGNGLLDEAAVEAAREWKFPPGLLSDANEIFVDFSLD